MYGYKFTNEDVDEWNKKFKDYFPSINGDYHYIIKLLWSGIGIFARHIHCQLVFNFYQRPR
jgi:hypothetical protein